MELSVQEQAFAAEVERCRAAAGVTQAWVAQRVGLSRPKISEVCSGAFLPSRQVLDALVTALAMDRQRAVELWRAARDGREQRRQAERMARLPRPEGWSALPVLPPAVRSLLRAQLRAAQELPYRLPGARKPSLETVYVRQELGGGVEESARELPRMEPVLDARGLLRVPAAPVLRLAVRPPARTVQAALDGDDHLLVTGGPGQGKSTLSLRLAADIAEAWAAPPSGGALLPEPVAPLRVTARELAARLDLPFAQALAGSVRGEYGAFLGIDVPPEALAGRVGGCRWLLLVDGLDEVAASAQRDRLVSVLAAWAADPASPYRLVVTTRPVEGAALAPLQRAGTARYELQPFDDAALQRFAVKWFAEEGEETALRFVRQIREAYLDELVRVPLLATIAAIVFTQHERSPLPDNRYELYEAYLEILRSARAAPSPFDPLRSDLLQHLGQVRLETDSALAAAACGWIAERIPAEDRPPGWREELTAFLAAVGPLVIRDGDLRFLHHSFAEHLSATAKARLLPATFDPEQDAFAGLMHAAQQGDYGRHARTVLLHYARLHPPEADRIVRWLHGGVSDQHLLAARLLSHRLPASTEVVDAFLSKVRAWAMTTQYGSAEILRRTSRAAHHPGLVPWLVGLMHDDDAPWQARVEAATALATRLRGTHTAAATTMLRKVVADPAVPIEDRLSAAEGLAEGDPAERQTAERELRSLLADPWAPPERRRRGAVVLAGLGEQPRTYAVQALLQSLDDPETPVDDLVQSAAALAEIGTEFHERSAAVFRTVLHDRARTMTGRRDAALGLAALGPDHLAEAARALTAIATDPGFDHFDRAAAAETLAELGPQHAAAAAGHLLHMLAEPGLGHHERWRCASALGNLGADYHQPAEAHLRLAAAYRNAGSNANLWAWAKLSELGPNYHTDAARELHRLAADPLAAGLDHAMALGRLATLGAAHRTSAAAQLRADLTDRHGDPTSRAWVARELVDLDPEFHPEVVAALLEIVGTASDPEAVARAGMTLASLGTRFRQPAAAGLLAALASPATPDYTLISVAAALAEMGAEYRRQAADSLARVLTDMTRSDMSRARAAVALAELGGPYRGAAVAGFCGLLRPDADPELPVNNGVTAFTSVGAGHRVQIADALRALLASPAADADHIWPAAKALIDLGFGDTPEVLAAIQAVAVNEAADISARHGAAVAIVRLHPESAPDALATLRSLAAAIRSSYQLKEVVLDLARLGDDVRPLARARLDNLDTERALRETAASTLARLHPDLVAVATAELRSQAGDEHLPTWERSDAIVSLADLDADADDFAVAFHLALVEDEDQPVAERCRAADRLARFDRAHWPMAVATLRRLLASPLSTPTDQQAALGYLTGLKALRPDEAAHTALAIFHHPAAQPSDRRTVIARLSGPLRQDAQRALLADHAAPIELRVPKQDYYRGDPPLPAETVAAVRDVLAAVESSPAERVDAAAALAGLSSRLVPEAAGILDSMSRQRNPAALQAIQKLARLNGGWQRAAFAAAHDMLTDPSRPRRVRQRAAEVIQDIELTPSPDALAFLRATAADERNADVLRICALFALRQVDGLDPLRAIRDDEHAPATSRWQAATQLLDYTVEDRARSARVLDRIASDASVRPALRWRAARDLSRLGAAGRNSAANALHSIAIDDTLPATARADAARLLAQVRPRRLPEARDILRKLTQTGNPLHRRHVLLALGALDTTEASQPLRTMAHDLTLTPVTRLRCAEALAQLRTDQREAASVTARELMHEATVPRHIRMHAARDLARWSELCRQEARNFLSAE